MVSDHFKGYIEDSIGETWYWWPLALRLRRLRAGHFPLNWKSVGILELFHASAC